MKVIWQSRALTDLEDILDYVTNRESIAVAKKLIKQIIN
jgi:plasmid stabilization system protein ParE